MRVFGYPLHPMLVHFPIAFWVGANACDAAALLGVAGAWRLGWLMLALGVAAALPAAGAGMLELIHLPEDAAPAANRHMLLMGSALTAYLIALVLRSDGLAPIPDPSGLPIALAAIGFFFLAWGGHKGAVMVYGHGVGRAPAKD